MVRAGEAANGGASYKYNVFIKFTQTIKTLKVNDEIGTVIGLCRWKVSKCITSHMNTRISLDTLNLHIILARVSTVR